MTNNLLLNKNRKSFTLIELLVVLALVAILSVVVILTLNPAELLKQARDSNRLSDLATVNTALNLFSSDVINGFMGTSSIVYVSIPDNASSTCGSLGLPTLPTGYTYNCVTTQNLRNTDGTGWIPVNFQRISSNTPISQLPIDPVNTTTTRLYYTYIPGGSWELNATVEASKNKLGGQTDLVSKDGGSSPSQYEIGTNLNLNPIDIGDPSLVGYWNFEEGAITSVLDHSGNGKNAPWTGSALVASGKIGQYSGNFAGTNYASATIVFPGENFTFSLWFNIVQDSSVRGCGQTLLSSNGWRFYQHNANNFLYLGNGSRYIYWAPTSAAWHHLACSITSSGSSGGLDWQGTCYGDGAIKSLAQAGYMSSSTGFSMGGPMYCMLVGQIDDARIYNRALSAAEMIALYNANR